MDTCVHVCAEAPLEFSVNTVSFQSACLYSEIALSHLFVDCSISSLVNLLGSLTDLGKADQATLKYTCPFSVYKSS